VSRTARAAAAGIAAAAVWIAVEPVWRRAFGGPHTELRLVGRMLAPEAWWKPVGAAVHLANGAMFGIAFDRLGGRGVRQAVVAAQVENAVLWPTMLVVDRVHPDVRDGSWPRLARDPRVVAQELAGHLVFGVVLGALQQPDR
jgi:hypothetical protein